MDMNIPVFVQKAMLSKLSISAWTATATDQEVSDSVNTQYGAQDNAGIFRKLLIDKDEMKPIRKIVNRARKFHYDNTCAWGEKSKRILPTANYQDYLDGMRQFEKEFDQAVDEFARNFNIAVANAQSRLGRMFRSEDYPTESELRECFKFQIDFEPIPTENDFRITLAEEEMDRIKTNLTQRIEKDQAKAMKELWQRLYTAIKHMAETLKDKDKIFRDSLVGNVISLANILPKLNVSDDKDLNDLCREVITELSVEPKDLRKDPQTKKDTAQAADNIMKKMEGLMGQAPEREVANAA